MKKLIIYSHHNKFAKINNEIKIKNNNLLIIFSLMISGMIIGATSIIVSEELYNIIYFTVNDYNLDYFAYFLKLIIAHILIFTIYLFLSFSSIGCILIILLPIIYGIAIGMVFAIYMIEPNITELCFFLILKLPSVSFLTIYVLNLTVIALKLSESVFKATFTIKNKNIDLYQFVRNILRLIPLSISSIIFEIIFFFIKNTAIIQ